MHIRAASISGRTLIKIELLHNPTKCAAQLKEIMVKTYAKHVMPLINFTATYHEDEVEHQSYVCKSKCVNM